MVGGETRRKLLEMSMTETLEALDKQESDRTTTIPFYERVHMMADYTYGASASRV